MEIKEGWRTEENWFPEKDETMVVKCSLILDDECTFLGEATVTLTSYEETTEYTFFCPVCDIEQRFTRMETTADAPSEYRTPDLSKNWWEFNYGMGIYVPLSEIPTYHPKIDDIQRLYGDTNILG